MLLLRIITACNKQIDNQLNTKRMMNKNEKYNDTNRNTIVGLNNNNDMILMCYCKKITHYENIDIDKWNPIRAKRS